MIRIPCALLSGHISNLDHVEKTFISIPVGWWSQGKPEHIISSIESLQRLPFLVLLTGNHNYWWAGFMGHHVMEHFTKTTDCNIVVIDKLSYAFLDTTGCATPGYSIECKSSPQIYCNRFRDCVELETY